jgi:hypothetical protein
LLGALNVRFLLLDGRQGSPGAGWMAREPAPGAAWLYENTSVRSRAFVVTDVRAEPDPRRAIALLRALNPNESAVIERPVAALGAPGAPATPSVAPARIVRYAETEMIVEATGPGLLVMSESFYPGWRATVDGVAETVVRANVHLRAVPLGAGPHVVHVWYDPLSVKVGFGLTAVAVGVNLAALGVAWHARRRRAA